MERIKAYIMSIIRLGLTVAAILIVINAFINVWDTYKIDKKCDTTISVMVSNYDIQKKSGGKPVGYPIAYYEVDGKTYEHKGTVEIGSYPYDKSIEAGLKYCSYEPETAIFEIELKKALNEFLLYLLIAASLIIIKVLIGLKEIYDNRS